MALYRYIYPPMIAVSCQRCIVCRESRIRHCCVFRDPLWLIRIYRHIYHIYPPTKALPSFSNQMTHRGNIQLCLIRNVRFHFHFRHKHNSGFSVIITLSWWLNENRLLMNWTCFPMHELMATVRQQRQINAAPNGHFDDSLFVCFGVGGAVRFLVVGTIG